MLSTRPTRESESEKAGIDSAPQRKVKEEFERYKDEPGIEPHRNLQVWWRQKKAEYPNVAILARKYLAIPATSVPCERVFSTAGNVMTEKRNRLDPHRASHLIFLHENRHFIKIQK